MKQTTQNHKGRPKRFNKGKVKRTKKEESAKPWEAVKMKMFKFPNPFPKKMSVKQRMEAVRSAGSKAKADFDKKYPKVEKWFKKYDAFYLLSFCATYFMSSPEGIDPEVSGKLDFPPHMIEILQAFALCGKRQINTKPLMKDAEKLQGEMRNISDLMMWRLVDIPKTAESDEEFNMYRLRMEMIATTTAVRNWAYYHQIKQVVTDLASRMDKDYKRTYGVSLLKLLKILFCLIEERSDLLNEHLCKVRSFYKKRGYKQVASAYARAFPENKKISSEELEEIWVSVGKKLSSFKAMLIYHSDLKLEQIYSFDVDHTASLAEKSVSKKQLKMFFDNLSYSFEDLKSFNKEYFILDNPVHHKPFIKVQNDVYFSGIWGVMPHIILNIFEDIVSDNPKLRKKYFDKIKSKYLEDRVEKLFREGFPSATIFRGGLWNDRENDLLVVVDTFAIVVEDKARLISPTVRRGAPLDLYETLRKLIEEPSEQALEFIEYLKGKEQKFTLQNKQGEKITIDPRKINYYIPLGVTFHHFGRISSNLKKLIDGKVVNKKIEQLAPSMSFTDLEIIFQLLPLEAEKVHYLARRREFEAHMLYEGDELDLLGFYLDNGFNIGEAEYSREVAVEMSLKSKELDPYILGSVEGKKVEKPELTMTQWWKDLLNTIAFKRIEGWMETSFMLLNSTKDDQEQFEKKFKKLIKLTLGENMEKPHNWVMFFSGPKRRRYSIAGYPYLTIDKKLRNNIMYQIMDADDVKKTRGCVVIGVNLKRLDYPYTVLARKAATELFDTLTLDS